MTADLLRRAANKLRGLSESGCGARWDPALADWLDSHVGQLTHSEDLRYADSPGDTRQALAVARAVLREDG